jgi:hypothetical protein
MLHGDLNAHCKSLKNIMESLPYMVSVYHIAILNGIHTEIHTSIVN